MTLGLKDLYYAVCTEADGAESYGTPKKMAEAMSADLSVKTADGSLYADDTLSESVTEFASGTLKLGIKDLTPEVLAELLGQAVDKNSVVWAGKEDEPPYVAVGFRAKKTGGKYRYVWLLKAKFKVPSEKYETKGESIKFNTPDIEASFTTRKKDKVNVGNEFKYDNDDKKPKPRGDGSAAGGVVVNQYIYANTTDYAKQQKEAARQFRMIARTV